MHPFARTSRAALSRLALSRLALSLAITAALCSAASSAFAAWPPGGIPCGPSYSNAVPTRLLENELGGLNVFVNGFGGTSNPKTWSRVNYPDPAIAALQFGYDIGGIDASDGLGGLLRVFSSSTLHASTNKRDVFYMRVTAANVAQPGGSTPYYSAVATTHDETTGSIIGDGSGGAYVYWVDLGSPLLGYQHLRHFNSSGVGVAGWPANGITWPAGDAQLQPDGSGGAYVFEWHRDSVFSFNTSSLRRYTSAGTAAPGWPGFGIPVEGTISADGSVTPTALVKLDATHYAAIAQETDGSVKRAEYFPVDVSGSSPSIGAPVTLLEGATIPTISVLPDDAGGSWAIWDPGSGAVAQHYSAAGEPLSSVVSPFDAAAVRSGTPVFAAGHAGGLVALWDDTRLALPAIRGRWLAADGTRDPATPDSGRVLEFANRTNNPFNTVHIGSAITDHAGGMFFGYESGDPGNTGATPCIDHATYADATPFDGRNIVTAVSGSGHVTRSPAGPTYLPGAVVTLTAVPDTGSVFAGWSGDTTTNATAITITVTQNRVYTATFQPAGNLGAGNGVSAFALGPVRPNPSVGATHVSFALPRESEVRLSVIDIAGREVRVLASGVHAAGRHEIALLDAGSLAPGTYFVRMRAGGGEYRERFVVLR